MSGLVPKGKENEFWTTVQQVYGNAPGVPQLSYENRVKQGTKLSAAIQAFVHRPQVKATKMKAEMQAFITSNDLPETVTDIFAKFTDVENFDNGWMLCYEDMASRIEPGRDFWETVTMNQGSNWQLIPEGASVEMQHKSADVTRINVQNYGAGFAWTDQMIRFRKIGPMLDLATDFRDGYFRDKADRHYALLTASSGSTVAADTAGSTTLEKDINTLNDAAFDLLEGLKDTRNLPDSQLIYLVITPQFKTRFLRAAGELSQAVQGSTSRTTYNVQPIFTFNSNLPSAASGETFAGLMLVPGMKSQMATLMQPTFFNDQEITSLSFLQTGFSYYGAGVLDTAQISTVGFA